MWLASLVGHQDLRSELSIVNYMKMLDILMRIEEVRRRSKGFAPGWATTTCNKARMDPERRTEDTFILKKVLKENGEL